MRNRATSGDAPDLSGFASPVLREVPAARSARDNAYLRNALISFAILVASGLVACLLRGGDRAAIMVINGPAGKSLVFDRIFYDLDHLPTLSGVVLISMIWYIWFGTTDLEMRARIAVGSFSSLAATCISRLLQHLLHIHARPIYDHGIRFVRPSGMHDMENTWNSFPSDHAVMFAGLVTVVFLVTPRLGLVAAVWTFIFEASRAYEGFHYPSDLIGGAALGAMFVWLSQAPAVMKASRPLLVWSIKRPALFYGCAFFASYQLATILADIRNATGGYSMLMPSMVNHVH